MQIKYNIIYERVINLINKYKYQQFVGPLTETNYPELIETMPQNSCLIQKYHLLTKNDMETRINYLDSVQKRGIKYIINSDNENQLFILFHWDELYDGCDVAHIYDDLSVAQKGYFSSFLLRNHIFFETLSISLILVGFDKSKIYSMNDDIEDE